MRFMFFFFLLHIHLFSKGVAFGPPEGELQRRSGSSVKQKPEGGILFLTTAASAALARPQVTPGKHYEGKQQGNLLISKLL